MAKITVGFLVGFSLSSVWWGAAHFGMSEYAAAPVLGTLIFIVLAGWAVIEHWNEK